MAKKAPATLKDRLSAAKATTDKRALGRLARDMDTPHGERLSISFSLTEYEWATLLKFMNDRPGLFSRSKDRLRADFERMTNRTPEAAYNEASRLGILDELRR